MPRPTNTSQRRSQISSGLIKVMARSGYNGASIAEIARAAELTPGLIHYHFKNKQEILLAALDDLVSRHEEELDEHLARVPDAAPDQVAAFINTHLGLGATADPDALACWVLLSGEALRQPQVQAPYAAAIAGMAQRLEALIKMGTSAGTFECEDPAGAAAAIIAAIQGYFVLAATARDVIPRGSAARSVHQMAQGVLQCQTPLPVRRPGS